VPEQKVQKQSCGTGYKTCADLALLADYSDTMHYLTARKAVSKSSRRRAAGPAPCDVPRDLSTTTALFALTSRKQ
jgi:hypothetical protein